MNTARYSFLFMLAAAAIPSLSTEAYAVPPLAPAGAAQQGEEELLPPNDSAGSARFPAIPEAGQCKGMRVLSRGVVAEAGRRLLELVVQNSGERPLSPAVSVDLFQKGEAVAQFHTTLRGIGPGASLSQRVDLSELPPGRYQVLTIVQNRDGEISGTREELDLP